MKACKILARYGMQGLRNQRLFLQRPYKSGQSKKASSSRGVIKQRRHQAEASSSRGIIMDLQFQKRESGSFFLQTEEGSFSVLFVEPQPGAQSRNTQPPHCLRSRCLYMPPGQNHLGLFIPLVIEHWRT
eukprot:scaffold19847_cov19-Tisochrysis_lutea.AAC.3